MADEEVTADDMATPEPGPDSIEPGSLLYRQVHPTHEKHDRTISAEAFNPTTRDEDLLSTLHGRVGPNEAYRRWTEDLKRESLGSFAVSVEEVDDVQVEADSGVALGLTAFEDGLLIGVADHVSIDFSNLVTRGRKKQAARKLLAAAMERGGPQNT